MIAGYNARRNMLEGMTYLDGMRKHVEETVAPHPLAFINSPPVYS